MQAIAKFLKDANEDKVFNSRKGLISKRLKAVFKKVFYFLLLKEN
jgi:hypothetical protein